MKTITINVSEPVYRTFQEYARRKDRSTSELIREAMKLYEEEKIRGRTSLRKSASVSVGEVKVPFSERGELVEEMFGEDRG